MQTMKSWKTVRGFESVSDYVLKTFDVSQFAMKSIPLPQGIALIDSTGSSVCVWWDILEQCVCYSVEVA